MTFRVPKIHSCCCFSLETGSKTIGYTHAFLLLLSIALDVEFTPPHARSFLWNCLDFADVQRVLYETPFLDMLIFTMVMLYGLFKRNHHLIFPWILLQTAFLVFIALSCYSHAAYLGLMDYSSGEMPLDFVLMVLQSWSILVVYNFYRELKEQQPT